MYQCIEPPRSLEFIPIFLSSDSSRMWPNSTTNHKFPVTADEYQLSYIHLPIFMIFRGWSDRSSRYGITNLQRFIPSRFPENIACGRCIHSLPLADHSNFGVKGLNLVFGMIRIPRSQGPITYILIQPACTYDAMLIYPITTSVFPSSLSTSNKNDHQGSRFNLSLLASLDSLKFDPCTKDVKSKPK